MGGTPVVSSWFRRSTYSRMEFRSLSMRTRSSAVSSRLASSATCSTSESVTFIAFARLGIFDLRFQSLKVSQVSIAARRNLETWETLTPLCRKGSLRLSSGPHFFRQHEFNAADVMAGELV